MPRLTARIDRVERAMGDVLAAEVLYGVTFGPCTRRPGTNNPTDWAILIWHGPGEGTHVDPESVLGRRLIYRVTDGSRDPCGCLRAKEQGSPCAHSHLGELWFVRFASDGSDLPPRAPEGWELPPWPHGPHEASGNRHVPPWPDDLGEAADHQEVPAWPNDLDEGSEAAEPRALPPSPYGPREAAAEGFEVPVWPHAPGEP
jgi:hypothetical protein